LTPGLVVVGATVDVVVDRATVDVVVGATVEVVVGATVDVVVGATVDVVGTTWTCRRWFALTTQARPCGFPEGS